MVWHNYPPSTCWCGITHDAAETLDLNSSGGDDLPPRGTITVSADTARAEDDIAALYERLDRLAGENS
jgi:hypothetical protein